MDLASDDSDAEFFDAREDISTPRSPDKPIADLLEEAVNESITGTDPNSAKVPEGEQIADVCDGVANAVECDSGNAPNLLKTLSIEACEFAGQTPDLLACVQDRPTDLPGVKPVTVIPSRQEEIIHNAHQAVEEVPAAQAEPLPAPLPEEKREDDKVPVTVPKPPRPESSPENKTKKKVPPSRPAPPKRPPPPKKSYLVSKPYLSESDEGLLTPNTTVDNLTREFAEALKKDEAMQEKSPPSNSISTDSKPNAVLHETTAESILRRKGSVSSHKSSASPASTLNRDEEILAGVIVKNLDTGESMPLSTAAEHVSSCLNPLALQIMSRTREFSYTSSNTSVNSHDLQSNSSMVLERQDIVDSDSLSLASDDIDIGKDVTGNKQRKGKKLKDKQKKFKKIVGKSMSKVKVVAGAQVEKAVHKVKRGKDEEQLHFSSDEDSVDLGSSSSIKIKTSSSNKGPYHFSHPKQVQDIAVHVGAVWCMKFSHCGRLLATSGQDNVIWVWVLKDFYNYFNDMRIKYDSKDEVLVHQEMVTRPNMTTSELTVKEEVSVINEPSDGRVVLDDDEDAAPFRQVPFSSYVGHSADVLDLAWSKNYFVLSSSMDKTVRLWHISRKECLCCFQHIDFVTAIAFHPRDDRYFLSGSLDSKLRLWNIPDKKVALWNEVSPEGSSASSATVNGGALITTVNFCENGKFAVCGTYDGRCVFFDTEHLKYHTQIHVRSSRGRNTKGHKVTGIEPLPGEHKILVTSNDSRVRLYDLRDLSLVCKYRGHANMSSQIKASFSPDAKYIICGSEDKGVYIWKTSLPQDIKLSSLRRDRNDAWESMKAHDAVVTCAVFAPQPRLLYKDVTAESSVTKHKSKTASILSLKTKKQEPKEVNVIISADFNGCIKVTVCAE